jgi:RHS repeat-associated core domain
MLATNTASSATYYGAPYFQYGYSNYGPWGSIGAAVSAWWADYQRVYPYAFPGCSYSLNLTDPNSTNNADHALGRVAIMPLSGTCGGWGRVVATAYSYSPTKNTGKPCNCAGDPINLGTGNEYRDDEDASLGGLSFHRYYNSHAAVSSSHIGAHWRHSFDRSLEYLSSSTMSTATVFRPDGLQVIFTLQNGQWRTDPDVADRLTTQTNAAGALTGWLYFDASTRYQEAYNANGNLLSITDTNGQVTTLAYSTTSTPASVAPSAGLLLTVTDPRGRSLNFTYNAQGSVATVTQPDGGVLGYAYDTNGNLVTVTYPDTKTRQYVYNESTLTGGSNLPSALTGDIDESGSRLTSIGYNSLGQATMSTLPGGVDRTQVVYNSNSTTSVTYPTGAQATLSFVVPNGSVHTSTVSAPCGVGCGQPNAAATFDSNGYVASTTDFNGNVTTMVHDANGLLDQEIDGSGSPDQRTTNTTWNATLRVPLQSTVTNASGTTVVQTAWVYNTLGQPLARCEIDPAQASSYTCATTGTPPAGVRRWTYSYCTAVDTTQCPIVGLLLAVDGPRTDVADVTTYAYYLTDSTTAHHGDLQSVTDALGHTTTYLAYDGAGRVTSLQDANGVVTNLTYTPRGWLASRSVGGATTTLGYTPYGAVASITDPDGITTSYTYDAAHRLTDITDAQGNIIHYTLDAAGNKTAEQIRTASGTVVHSLSRTYNTLGQLTALVDGLSQTVFNAGTSGSYDGNGNLVHSADALGVQRQQGFDALNRLQSTIANYNGSDPATKNTQSVFAYDARDDVEGVSDPDGLSTTYDYDGLGNRTALHSPDTGTSSDTYDAAGNRLTHTDAKGIVSTSTYDAGNRLTSTGYPDTTLNVSYTYDEANAVTGCSASNPIGRLTRVVEAGVTTVFCYDGRGNVLQKRQLTASQTDTTLYAYTAGNRLSSESTPDQTAISYTYDTNGRVSGVQVTPAGATTAPPTVVSSISYLPFGPISSYTLGNGQTVTRTYDANYRLTDLTSPALALHFNRDALGNIIALGNTPGANPATETYSYDPLYRLTGVSDAGTALESYTYNPTGDRLSKTAPGLATGAYLYTTGTHQLASINGISRANDANGNTTGSVIGGNTYGFGYNARNRLTVAQLNGATVGTYTYNALGQRIGKVATFPQAITERYAYNEAGQLIGDYGTSSSTLLKGKGKHRGKHHQHAGIVVTNNRDYVWLGDIPVAVIDNSINGSVTTSTINYVTADQLGTPRAVTDGTGTVIWSWAYQGNAFGEQQPTSTTGYVLNLRYPGQYYDAESGTNYNYFRTYEAATGRYLQSDPIGLTGGISTYAYVGGDPLSYTDPLGLSGLGFNAGGSAQGGLINGGAMQASSGVGLFWGHGLNAGGYTASGSFAGQGNFDYHSPGEQGDSIYTPDNGYSTMAIGASAGLGVGAFYTNADSAEQLLGAFDTSTLNVGFVTLQWAEDASGTYTASLGFAKGLGFDFNRYQVITTSAGTFYRRRTSACN